MAKDAANILNLEGDDAKKYDADPWCDAFESTKNFAKRLERYIETKQTPHVLLLEGKYGIGKTFFATRFKKSIDKKFHAIYFSAWENDYFKDPFLAFSKVVMQHFHPTNAAKALTKKAFEGLKNVLKAGAKASSVNFNFALPHLLGAEIGGNFDCGAFIDSLEKDYCQSGDPLCEFKRKFEKFVKGLSGQKLVIIVDELDRCRPDYAMKVLEITKHFFDIEGVFVIIPTNKTALKRSLQALYGIDMAQEDTNTEIESYYTKFFNDESHIPDPDYARTVAAMMPQKALNDAFSQGFLSDDTEAFSSYATLIEKVAEYAKQGRFSLRQTQNICTATTWLCNNFYEEIRCEYLAFLMCNREMCKKRDSNHKPLTLTLDGKNPYGAGAARSQAFNLHALQEAVDEKIAIIRKRGLSNPIIKVFYNFENNIQNLPGKESLKNYANAKAYIDELAQKLQALIDQTERFDEGTWNKTLYLSTFKQLQAILDAENAAIAAFKKKYDGDDDFAQRKKIYDEIAKDPDKISDYASKPSVTPVCP